VISSPFLADYLQIYTPVYTLKEKPGSGLFSSWSVYPFLATGFYSSLLSPYDSFYSALAIFDLFMFFHFIVSKLIKSYSFTYWILFLYLKPTHLHRSDITFWWVIVCCFKVFIRSLTRAHIIKFVTSKIGFYIPCTLNNYYNFSH
jgi:hypothetical protein